jgi:hypothetical protein
LMGNSAILVGTHGHKLLEYENRIVIVIRVIAGLLC